MFAQQLVNGLVVGAVYALIGRHCKMRTGPVCAIFRLPGMVAEEHQAVAEAMELLKFTGIDAYASGMAEALSYGDQKRLEIARALMSRPSLLLLDEPSLGLAPKIIETIFEVLARIREEGTGIFLVEQNAHLALNFSDWAYVMETGRIVMGDEPDVLRDSPAVREAYLGE